MMSIGMIGFISGLLITFLVLMIYSSFQPALCYICPSLIIMTVVKAKFDGGLKELLESRLETESNQLK